MILKIWHCTQIVKYEKKLFWKNPACNHYSRLIQGYIEQHTYIFVIKIFVSFHL